MTAGVLTESECKHCMEDFIRKSHKLSESWELLENGDKCYLRLKLWKVCSTLEVPGDDSMDTKCELEVVDEDSATYKQGCIEQSLLFEYYVIYSESYSVPVLYFNVYNSNGGLVPMSKVWNMVPEHYRKRLEEDKWTFITQTEHPYLGRPFYQLHPCHTAKLMDVVSTCTSNTCSNYLISWLSAVGPVVLLDLPLAFGYNT